MTNTALYEKLSLVMKSCSYIEKTGEKEEEEIRKF